MKASEVMRRYAAGERDFRGVNLRGQSFKGQNLSGADFTGADIRSVNFSNADLTDTNFRETTAGLQKQWIIFLTIVSCLLSMLSGISSWWLAYLTSLIFYPDVSSQFAGWVGLFTLFIFVGAVFSLGIGAGAVVGAVVVALAVMLLAVASNINSAVSIGGFVSVALAGAGVGAIALTLARTVVGIETGSVAAAVAGSTGVVLGREIVLTRAEIVVLTTTLGFVGAIGYIAFSIYVSRLTMRGDKRYFLVRNIVVAFAAIRGTSFRSANLTDTNFASAYLKSTDFRKAKLIRTYFHNTEFLDQVRPGNSYLQYPQVHQLISTGQGQCQNFDRFDLRGINLQNANLTNISFIEADLTKANLKNTDLSGSKLVKTQLDGANLIGANLTGAYIEGWGITARSILNDMKCDYIFMRLPLPGDRDPNPRRKPDDWNKYFAPGEFIDFITPLVQTLDLYHNQVHDPRLITIAFEELRSSHPEAKIEPVGIERRGKNRDGILIKAETSPQADHSQLHAEYFDKYENLQALPLEAVQVLLRERGSTIQLLAGILSTKHNIPEVSINNSQYQGDKTVTSDRTIHTGGGDYSENIEGDYIQQQGSFGVGVNKGEIKANKIAGTYNEAQQQTLAETAAEIQDLLEQLDKTYDTGTYSGKGQIADEIIKNIENNPSLKARILSALKVGSVKAFEQFLSHPAASFVIGALEDWKKNQYIF